MNSLRVFLIFAKDIPEEVVRTTTKRKVAVAYAKSGHKVLEFPLSMAHGVSVKDE